MAYDNSGWSMVNGTYVPVFNKDDFSWTANDSYDPNASQWNTGWRQGSGDTAGWEQYTEANPNAVKGQWGLSELARARLVGGGWNPDARNNIGWNNSTEGTGDMGVNAGGLNFLQGANDPNVNPYSLVQNASMKNSNSTALRYKYTQDANGNMIPTADVGMNWGTNNGEQNRHLLAAVGLMAGAGVAGAAMAPAAAGAEAGGATALGTGDVALGTAANTGLVDAGTLAGADAAGTAGGASGLTELGTGAVEPLSSAPTIAEAQQPWWQTAYDYAKTANEYKGYYDKANKAYNMMNPQEQSFQHYNEGYDDLSGYPSGSGGDYGPPGSAAPDYNMGPPGDYAGGQYPNSTGGNFDWNRAGRAAGSLADMYGAWYSSQQLKDQAGNEKLPFSREQGLQDPYNMMLRASYTNPETYYQGQQWRGLKDVYQNSIDRQAAKGGTLGNPTDREVKLNNYAMKSIEDYRTGLRNNVNAYNAAKYNQMYSSGLGHEAGANTGAFATATKGGTAGNVNTVKQYIEMGKTAKEIYDFVSGWLK